MVGLYYAMAIVGLAAAGVHADKSPGVANFGAVVLKEGAKAVMKTNKQFPTDAFTKLAKSQTDNLRGSGAAATCQNSVTSYKPYSKTLQDTPQYLNAIVCNERWIDDSREKLVSAYKDLDKVLADEADSFKKACPDNEDYGRLAKDNRAAIESIVATYENPEC